jgi:lysophospholipase L1-like esterase
MSLTVLPAVVVSCSQSKKHGNLLSLLLVFLTLAGLSGCSAVKSTGATSSSQSSATGSSVASTEPVVFIGDSVTALFASTGFGQPEWSQHPNWTNKGIVGQNSNQILARFQTDVIDLKPAVVVILAGTNDVYPDWNLGPSEVPAVFLNYIDSPANIEQMVQMAQSAGIKVVLGTIPPWNCLDQTKCALATTADPSLSRYQRIDVWNAWLRVYASQNQIAVADYWLALVAQNGEQYPNSLTVDGVHPSAAGFTAMTPEVEGAIERVGEGGIALSSTKESQP